MTRHAFAVQCSSHPSQAFAVLCFTKLFNTMPLPRESHPVTAMPSPSAYAHLYANQSHCRASHIVSLPLLGLSILFCAMPYLCAAEHFCSKPLLGVASQFKALPSPRSAPQCLCSSDPGHALDSLSGWCRRPLRPFGLHTQRYPCRSYATAHSRAVFHTPELLRCSR